MKTLHTAGPLDVGCWMFGNGPLNPAHLERGPFDGKARHLTVHGHLPGGGKYDRDGGVYLPWVSDWGVAVGVCDPGAVADWRGLCAVRGVVLCGVVGGA